MLTAVTKPSAVKPTFNRKKTSRATRLVITNFKGDASPGNPTPAANVLAARAWIAAWKARTSAPHPVVAAPASAAAPVPANVAEVRAWIAAWKARSSGGATATAVAAAPVPANVAEVRAWIAAWKARSSGSTAAAPVPAVPVPANVAEVRAWIAAWRTRTAPAAGSAATATQSNSPFAPCKVLNDGTVVFTSEKLKSPGSA